MSKSCCTYDSTAWKRWPADSEA